MKKISVLLLALGLINLSKAEELIGVFIHYKALSSLKYEVSYKVYSDGYPKGVKDLTPLSAFTFRVISAKNSIQNFPILVSTKSFVTFFKTDRGCLEYIYTDTIDLNDSKFKTIKNSGDCKVYFGVSYSKRFTTLANISQSSYFSYSYIDICLAPLNNSAVIGDFKTYIPSNKAVQANSYYLDLDADSLVYSLSNPMFDYNSDIKFKAGYSTNKNFDSDTVLLGESGELIIAPKTLDSNYVGVVDIKEFRNIGGQYREIGGVRHDFVVKVIRSGNNLPVLNGPYKYTVDAGQQICFTITSDDKTFIPPPPAITPPPDTVRLTWNRGIPGASFSILDPKTRIQAGKFCWTPKLSNVSDLPYIFTVTASDNFWLLSEKTVKSYSIKVMNPVNAINKTNPSNISIYPNPILNQNLSIQGNGIEEVQIITASGQMISKWGVEQTNHFEKNISDLSSGIYFISVKANGFYYRTKIIKP